MAAGVAAASLCIDPECAELKTNRGGSRIGRLPNRDRGRGAGAINIDSDYFCRLPHHANIQPYLDKRKFRPRYRVSRDIY
jgi:hypothetical protein